MRKSIVSVGFGLVLVAGGCSNPAEPPSPAASPRSAAAPPAATPTDETGLRTAALRALSEQRLYAPAGDNAIEHYLALRALVPGDPGVETALLELLPYAVIGSEQATARGQFDEARRLVDLVQRTDPGLPALSRLRDRLAVAEVLARQAAERAALEAEASARRQAEHAAAARLAAPADPSTAPASTPAPGASIMPAPSSGRLAATPATQLPTVDAPTTAPSPAATRAAAPPPLPRLLEAPQPRYPLMALRRKLEGDVVLELRIEADGRVGQARVLSANPPGLFDEAAVAAAERWRFAPGAVAVTTRQVLRFRLPKPG